MTRTNMKFAMAKSAKNASRGLLSALGLVIGLSLAAAMPAAAQGQSAVLISNNSNVSQEGQFFRGGFYGSSGVSGGIVALPNGKYTEYTEDLRVKVAGGYVRWSRDFNGNQWRFNPAWLSLEFEFDTIAVSMGSSGGGGGGGSSAAVMAPPVPPEFFGGTRMPGTGGSLGPAGRTGPLWAVSRNGSWFLVDDTSCSFALQNSGRYLLKPVFNGAAPACPTNKFAGAVRSASLSAGSGAVASSGSSVVSGSIRLDGNGGMPANVSGFRWEDRLGDWIEYDRNGRVSAYGDRNNIRVTMQYTGDRLTGVLDHLGRLVMVIGYDGNGRVSDVRDVPTAADPSPARVVRYEYAGNGSISKVTDVRGNVIQYGYDDKARLKTVTDQEGRVRGIEYGPTSRVTKLTQPDASVTEYEYDYDKTKKQFLARVKRPEVNGQRRVEVSLYDTDGQLISQEVNNRVQRELSQEGRNDKIIDGRGNVTETQRNEFNQVVSVRYADGATQSNQFDAKTMALMQQSNPNGTITRIERDAVGNARRHVQAVGTAAERTTEITRDERFRARVVVVKGRSEANGTVTPDASWQMEYDDYDNLLAVTDPEAKVTRYTYNRMGQTLSETDPRGGAWRYTYDPAGNVLTSTSPLGFVSTAEYDKVGNEVRATDSRGKVYTSTFDGRDRETRTIDPYGAVYATEYTAMGTVASVTDASGKSMRFEYDAWTRPSQAWDGKGFSYVMDYVEADGKDTGVRQPNKVKYPTFERYLKYNQRNRPSQRTDFDGGDSRTEQYTYDGIGRRKTVTDANGRTRTLNYNPFGQLASTADSMGNEMRIAYDVRGNIAEVTDPNGRKTQFSYNRRDLLISQTDPLGKTTRYTYDDNGWPLQTQLPNGALIEYEHDADGRLVKQREFAPNAVLVKTTIFGYDADDNLTNWGDGRFSAELSYDDAGRKVGETVSFGSFTKGYSYTYYPNNQLKTYTGPDAVTIVYAYDAMGQLERVSIPGEGDISVTDWQWAARKSVLLPGGSEQRFEHDGLLMTTKLKVVNPGQATIFELEEKYGKAQEVSESRREGALTTYGYDDAYRLTGVQAPNAALSEGYTVDAAGNRVSHTRGGTTGSTWVYDAANQLKQRGTISYEYDENGNLSRKTDTAFAEPRRTTRFYYDPLNRLSEVRDGDGALVAQYRYDPFDRRLSKQLGDDGPTTYYLTSAIGLLAEISDAGDVRVSYGWHPEEQDSTYPLYARFNDGSDSRYVYYHNDHLGTPQRMTDKSGVVVWAAEYDGFGRATVRNSSAAPVINNLRYPGQYFDAETGLHYNNRRFYDAETGRYLTRDPIGFAGGVNLYAYAAHSPTNLIDPTGEILPCLAINYLRCMASCMLMSAAEDYLLECGNINWGDNAKDCAIDCLLGMLPLPNPCGKFGKWLNLGLGMAGGLNSFTAETVVQVRPHDASDKDALVAKAMLKPISDLRVGDQVLALSEWKEKGADPKVDARLSYEPVTDVFTSQREQTLVRLQLDDGETLTATEGHPFKTSEGWRDAVMLKRGGNLLLKGDGAGDAERTAAIVDVVVERKTVQVFNLEVARAHTFFVGSDGVLVHNGPSPNGRNGNQPHQDTVADAARRLIEEGADKVTQEHHVPLPPGTSKKKCRFIDVVGWKNGKPYKGVQVGKNTKSGVPVKRERDALDDIRPNVNFPVDFDPYN
jgi:RHS repeat-associated protein